MKGLWELGVRLRTRDEIRAIAASAALAAEAVRRAGRLVTPGSRLEAAKCRAERYALAHGASDVRVYTSLNSTAAHGQPGEHALRHGDLVTVDVSACLGGWYGDVAGTFVAGRGGGAARRLLTAAWESARLAAYASRGGARISDVARTVLRTAGRFGCTVAEECAGHGIGRRLHEEPSLGYADPRVDGYLVPGMVFTVEPVLTLGIGLLVESPSGGLVTADGSLAAQFEMTVAVLADGPHILGSPEGPQRTEGSRSAACPRTFCRERGAFSVEGQLVAEEET